MKEPFLSHTPKNIIVRMPNWLGDLVMATPILRDLRSAWPNSTITAMCHSNISLLLREDPNVDELFSFTRPSGWLHRIRGRDIVSPLQKGNYDLGILLTNSFSSALWFWMGNIPQRIGFAAHYRKPLLSHPIPYPEDKERQHLVVTYKALLEEAFGIPISTTAPKLHISKEDQELATQTLKNHGVTEETVVIGINPGAAYGSAKCWLPDRFQKITTQLLDHPNIHIVYFGDRPGRPLVDAICEKMPKRVINLAGKTNLRELIALIDKCDLFLTNDSGPMHIASALDIPLLALFGSTSDVATGPYSGGRVIHKHVNCSPCYKRTCPIDFRCMTRIGVQEVYEELQKMLKEQNL